MEEISFDRCIKPTRAIDNPCLRIFCDGSDNAFGACAYARWKVEDALYESNLIASKNRITPLKRITTVRSELCGAVLGSRLKVFIEKESRLKYKKVFFITDSKIVQAMVHKESYGFNTYVAVRIGEIQESADPQTWYWVDGKLNLSDWLTRGKAPCELDLHSTWQKGPEFLRTHEDLWPIKNERWNDDLPEQVKVVMSCELARETLAERTDINRYSSYRRLIRVTARILSMYQRPNPSLMNIMNVLEFQDLCMAEIFWFKDAQLLLKDKFYNGKLKRLFPKLRSDGIIVVSTRDVEWHTYDELQLILLPYNHRISRLYAECVHREGVMSTASKIRSRVWITNLPKIG